MTRTRHNPDPSLPPVCSRCQENGGLCVECATQDRSILPQLAAPPWVKLMAKAPAPKFAGVEDIVFALPTLGTPGRKAARRLFRALNGEFAPVRRSV